MGHKVLLGRPSLCLSAYLRSSLPLVGMCLPAGIRGLKASLILVKHWPQSHWALPNSCKPYSRFRLFFTFVSPAAAAAGFCSCPPATAASGLAFLTGEAPSSPLPRSPPAAAAPPLLLFAPLPFSSASGAARLQHEGGGKMGCE